MAASSSHELHSTELDTVELAKQNAIVDIQDIVVFGEHEDNRALTPCGEYTNPELFGGQPVSPAEPESSVIARLYHDISHLIESAGSHHREMHFTETSQLKPDRLNNVTRLITNEFFFYTAKPLTLSGFERLMQSIHDFAATQPENAHVLLGSFAVLTNENTVMNVVPHIECGKKPIINLLVKNRVAFQDPTYYVKNDDEMILCPNVYTDGYDISNNHITLNDQPIPFTYDTVVICQTRGGALFYSGVDICVDHNSEIAKKGVLSKMDSAYHQNFKTGEPLNPPNQYVHTLVSNTTKKVAAKSLGVVTHADPVVSKKSCRIGMDGVPHKTMAAGQFGTRYNVVTTAAIPAYSLSAEWMHILLKNFPTNEAALFWAIDTRNDFFALALIQNTDLGVKIAGYLKDKQLEMSTQISLIQHITSDSHEHTSSEQIALNRLIRSSDEILITMTRELLKKLKELRKETASDSSADRWNKTYKRYQKAFYHELNDQIKRVRCTHPLLMSLDLYTTVFDARNKYMSTHSEQHIRGARSSSQTGLFSHPAGSDDQRINALIEDLHAKAKNSQHGAILESIEKFILEASTTERSAFVPYLIKALTKFVNERDNLQGRITRDDAADPKILLERLRGLTALSETSPISRPGRTR